MSEKPNEIVEAYKKRISDLIDEAEKAIGYSIETVEIHHKIGLMTRRAVRFNVHI
jgi:hypothetical protein